MEYLRPRLVNIGGSTYRHREERFTQEFGLDEEEIHEVRNCEEDWTLQEEEDCSLEYLSQNRYKALLDIPPVFFGYLIGKRGATKREMEVQMGVKITFPPASGGSSSEEGVKIIGENKASVMRACRRLLLKVQDLRSKADWTHFISIPLSFPLAEVFQSFKARVLLSEPGLDENIFQKPQFLHLTIGVLALLTEKELVKAKKTLDECLQYIIRPILGKEELNISINGLQIMNDDPSDTKVLFAKVQSEKLQKIADAIVQKFADKGISQPRDESVKLHVTLMNTKFIMPPSTDQRRRRPHITFDATQILHNFADEEFGNTSVKEIHLSKMAGADKYSLKGFYESSHVITF